MRKILYIISTLKKTGPVNVLYNIIKNLDKTKYEPIILTLSKESNDSMKDEFDKLHIKYYCLNVSGIKGYFEAKKIKNIIKKIKPDIIHTQCFRSTVFTALYLKNYKTIATIHCDYNIDFVMAYGKFIGILMSILMDLSLRKIKKRICVSKLLSNLLNKKIFLNFEYVDNGIDTDKFKPIENNSELREKLNLPCNKKIFIWAGVMIERKNPLLLVNAIKELNNSDLLFVFCGNGNIYSRLQAQIKKINNVILTGNVNNIDEYLKASDYYISTSLSEGLPMSVIEAMSCGLPVVLSDIEQHKYVLKRNNIGITFKTNDVHELKNAIISIINKNYIEYCLNARKCTEENFSSKIMTKNYENKYEEMK